MRKLVLLLIVGLLILGVASAVYAKDGSERPGRIAIKAGAFIPVSDEAKILSTGVAAEVTYTFYKTEKVDVNGIFGYFRTEMDDAAFPTTGLSAHLNNYYFMGGVDIYPKKEGFYVGVAGGGVVNDIHPQPDKIASNLDNTITTWAFKVHTGYTAKNGVLIEGGLFTQGSDKLTTTLNTIKKATVPTITGHPNTGIYIMGGYKF